MRILHLSDVHVPTPSRALPWRAFGNKRAIAWLNYQLRRRRHFTAAAAKLQALAGQLDALGVDAVLCTGDYTTFGTLPELETAHAAVQALTTRRLGFVTLPGNHDLYLADSCREAHFERCFGAHLQSDLPAFCTDGAWPLVRLWGDEVAVIALNSAVPRPAVWRSDGEIAASQLDALRQLLTLPALQRRFVLIATHHAPCLADGRPDKRLHGLQNAQALLEACTPVRHGLIAHGHVHRGYRVELPQLPIPIFGAGSATQAGRERLWRYDIEGGMLKAAARGRWHARARTYVFEDDDLEPGARPGLPRRCRGLPLRFAQRALAVGEGAMP
ncbi:MAG: metallophosphoesterase family protein [Polyangiales bacterium]